MVWTPETEFPQSSVAVHVLAIDPSARHPDADGLSEKVGTTDKSQVSDAVAYPVAVGV
jgi:hypothetical protein